MRFSQAFINMQHFPYTLWFFCFFVFLFFSLTPLPTPPQSLCLQVTKALTEEYVFTIDNVAIFRLSHMIHVYLILGALLLSCLYYIDIAIGCCTVLVTGWGERAATSFQWHKVHFHLHRIFSCLQKH